MVVSRDQCSVDGLVVKEILLSVPYLSAGFQHFTQPGVQSLLLRLCGFIRTQAKQCGEGVLDVEYSAGLGGIHGSGTGADE